MTRRLSFQQLLHRVVGEGATPFPELFHLILDPFLIIRKANQLASSTIFWVFGLTWPGIELQSCSGLMRRVFANGPEDWCSIPGQVIPKTQKIIHNAPLFHTQHYKIRIKVKVEKSGNGVEPSPTPQCSSYWKRSLLVILDLGHQIYLYIYIYIYIYIWFCCFN